MISAVVLVGERKDSQTYVNSKKKGCAEVGFESFGTDLSENATEEMVLQVRPETYRYLECQYSLKIYLTLISSNSLSMT